MKKHWDIFCKVVDNFGDIGVCWRLARQLQSQHNLQVRLFVDDLTSAQKIIPNFNIKNQQVVDEVDIFHWSENTAFGDAADVVIEAFACDLPPNYLASMSQKQSVWVNLEYLSAEKWVDDFHAKSSPKPALKLVRHFYFPGFTKKTGGLIREMNAFKPDNQTQISPQSSFPRKRESILGLESKANWIPAFAGMTQDAAVDNTLNISLFCYPFAPIADLLNALQANNHAVSVHVPQSSILPIIADYFGKKTLQIGDKLSKNNLTVHILPFLSQADYDALLRNCDVNFVRGEDSWIRAIWAGKPFIWQPYQQDENAHMQKLDAFLDLFYANYNAEKKDMLYKAHGYWSAGQLPEAVLNIYLADLNNIQAYTQLAAQNLASQPDLAAKLVIFCNKM